MSCWRFTVLLASLLMLVLLLASLLFLASLLLWISLLLLLVFLSSIMFLTFLSDSGDPAAVDIHDVPIVPATDVISDVNSVPSCYCWLHYFCKHPRFCLRLSCAGCPLVAVIPVVAFFSAVFGSHAIAIILVAGFTTVACIPAVDVIPTVAGIPLIKFLMFLLLLAPLLLLAFLLLLSSL
jgi:hypothetical protein